MKTLTNTLKAFIALIVFFSTITLYAQNEGKETEAEGTDFWFGLPHCERSSDENLRGSETNSPYELFITSKVNTTVRIYLMSDLYKTVNVLANIPMVVALPDGLENQVSEKVAQKGFHVDSDDPIALVVYVSWQWTGEAFRVVPTNWLGKEYYTLNLYQDYNKMHDESFAYHPAQILIVASEDNTTVSYKPTYETEKNIKQGQTKTVKLNQGETFLIKGKININMTQSWQTDLTGSYINADKPIAVYSGHTKGSFPRHSATMLGYKSDFMRNMYMDAMWPVELLGKEYVSAPIMYTGRTSGYGTVTDDRGDIIRFVATKNNTMISMAQSDGSGYVIVAGPLNAGEDFRIMESLTPNAYKSNYPVLVGQYGKSWWRQAVHDKNGDEDGKDDEQLQNPPWCGQGMMLTLTPNSHWCNYSGFNSPKGGMFNYVNLIFKTIHIDSIKFDNRKLKDEFGSRIKKIPGTEYSYVSAAVNAGGHVVQATKNNVTFACYSYGNLDGYKDGFAYGYPAAVNYLSPCNDKIYIEDVANCEIVDGTVISEDLQTDVTCAGIYRLEYDKSTATTAKFTKEPYKIGDKTAKFKIVFRNNKIDSITVRAMTKSGNTASKTYYYYPDMIESSTSLIKYEMLEVNKPSTKSFEITNTGLKPIIIDSLYFNPSIKEYSIISPTNLKNIPLAPNEKITVTVQVVTNNPDAGDLKAEIWARLNCYAERVVMLNASPGEPDLDMNNLTWDNVPINTDGVTQTVNVFNNGKADAYIYDMSFDDVQHFRLANPIDFTNPIVIKPKEHWAFDVIYNPGDQINIQHTTVAKFETNARKTVLESIWTGDGITAGPRISNYDWKKRRVIDEWSIAHGVIAYDGEITVQNEGNTNLTVKSIKVNSTEGFFILDQDIVSGIISSGLEAGVPVTIPTKFIPTVQRSYDATVEIIGVFNNKEVSATGLLLGEGLQPHIKTNDQDFGIVDLTKTEKTVSKDVIVKFQPTVPNYDMDVTVTDLVIAGANADKFTIDLSKFTMPTATNPIVIPITDSIKVPVIFDPLVSGVYTATLTAVSDAPSADDNVGTLNGEAFIYGVTTTPYNFPPTYIHTLRTNGTCSITNTGTVPIYIKKALNIENDTKIGDVTAFQVNYSYITDNPTATFNGNTATNIEILPGKTLELNLNFNPIDVKNYNMKVRYYYNIANPSEEDKIAESEITGPGMEYLLVAQIPKNIYHAQPGDVFGENGLPTIDFKLFRDDKEVKSLDSANITEFKAYVTFSKADDIIRKDVYPMVSGPSDIITAGTMTEGWTVRAAQIIGSKELYVSMKTNGEPLTASDNNVLFRFKMKAYLSNLDTIPMPCVFTASDESDKYIKYTYIEGDISVGAVCIDTARLIDFSGLSYDVGLVNPNPVQSVGTIDYTVPINCTVTIDIYNVNGEKVTTLVNQRMAPGKYQAQVDTQALGLGSGVYTYRIEMGPYKETKTMIIQK